MENDSYGKDMIKHDLFKMVYQAFEVAVVRLARDAVKKEVEQAVSDAFAQMNVVTSFNEELMDKMREMIKEHEHTNEHASEDEILELMRSRSGAQVMRGAMEDEIKDAVESALEDWTDEHLEDKVGRILENSVTVTLSVS